MGNQRQGTKKITKQLAFVAALALVGAACADDAPTATGARSSDRDDDRSSEDTETDTGGTGDPVVRTGGAGRFVRGLRPFDDCSALLDYVQGAARDRVGPYGLDGQPGYWLEGDVFMSEDTAEASADMAMDEMGQADRTPISPAGGNADTGGDDSDGSFTGTNVQEQGVDEPDIVKTDGERIITISNNVLTYVDVTDRDAEATDRLRLGEGWNHELFFSGDRAFVFTNGGSWGYPMPVEEFAIDSDVDDDAEASFADDEFADDVVEPYRPTDGPAAVITEIDLSNPDNLRIESTVRIEGQYLSARAIGDQVRLAVSSGPQQLPWLYPQNQSGEERAERANREIIDESTIDDWMPSYQLSDGDSLDVDTAGLLLDCARVQQPAEFSGFDVISVVDLDLGDGLEGSFGRLGGDDAGDDAVGVVASGQTVYSSTDRFYVATTKWAGADLLTDNDGFREWSDDYETDVHAFAIGTERPTEYVASGTVAGSLLNQFSLDEHEGHLRVITTDSSPWDDGNISETKLVVLEERGDELVAVGEVGGLGKGETLYSARLMGDVGFAVTFRQIDPFYVLDLADPTRPRVAGELKIPGFSTYLHPVGDDLVLGVGQDATENGQTTGLKLSLFDVSDPDDPREVSVWTSPNATSPVEYDHRAFQMWGSTAIVPVQSWDGSWNGGFNGAIVFDIGRGIEEIGRITTDNVDDEPSDCRVLSIDDLSDDGADETELFWMLQDQYTLIQLCDSGELGGYGSHYCDVVPFGDLQGWFGDDRIGDLLDDLVDSDEPRLEICYPDGGYQEAIQRSLLIDDTIWTLTPSVLQGNDLESFRTTDRVNIA